MLRLPGRMSGPASRRWGDVVKIAIQRGCLSYGGNLYEAGHVVDIDDATAKRLIGNSGGDFVALEGTNDAAPASAPAPKESLDARDSDTGELPAPDLSAAVQGRGKKK